MSQREPEGPRYVLITILTVLGILWLIAWLIYGGE